LPGEDVELVWRIVGYIIVGIIAFLAIGVIYMMIYCAVHPEAEECKRETDECWFEDLEDCEDEDEYFLAFDEEEEDDCR